MMQFFQPLEKNQPVFPTLGKTGVVKVSPVKKGSRGWKRGLTLIEVMLAVVILGIGSGVLLLATARCIAIISKARHYSTAQRLIQQVGAEHPLTRAQVEAGAESGTFDDENDYKWEREIKEPEDENRKGLYTIRTRVSWSDRGGDRFEEVTTLLFIKPEETN